MNSVTSKSSPGVVEERSVPAVAGARRESADPGVGRAAEPEVAQVARRRRYSDEYKLRILADIEADPRNSVVSEIFRRYFAGKGFPICKVMGTVPEKISFRCL